MVDPGRSADLAVVLSALELQELKLLSWGAHHGRFSEDELRDCVADHARGDSADDLIDALFEHGLLFAVPGGGYRTRMAETVRVLATLRQVFATRPWWQSPELVLDYRILHRPRRQPIRDHDQDELVATASVYSDQATRALKTICPDSLSGFQMRSSEAIQSGLQRTSDVGVVVSAGTGSGKTLAFYLPAITWIVDSISDDPRPFVRTLAIYPRNELLKDQLKTALRHSLDIASSGDVHLRPLRLGAWFGAVPRNAYWVKQGWSGWEQTGKGASTSWRCPYLDCPQCDEHLVWRLTDVLKGKEQLHCESASCSFALGDDRISLTREAAIRRPPDVMFTTTESLNRQLASPDTHAAFGLGGTVGARIVLLDEVHTYGGITGAQNAFFLRRLRNALGHRPIVWVGLSATLLRARDFFAEFAGLDTEDVVVTEPLASELEEAGAEYLLALRHNPASITGPLSATIQAAMALQRCLDAPASHRSDPFTPTPLNSGGLFGTRTFVFTDKLDVTNRLYWDLLDAEGWWDERKPRRNRVPSSLAHTRSASQQRLKAAVRDPKEARLEEGQWWWMSEALGHGLDADRQLAVGRTSSQDQGVSDADVIVATATLEVGYDDDSVGAVLQHKAPHDAARFLQRKGRAGRNMDMRPWTVVVLSDWGRDRFAWQAYDQLFDPQLEATRLPTGNRYVRRMQAVYATLDWLGTHVRLSRPDRNAWADLAGPADIVERNSDRALRRKERQDLAERLLAEVLDGGPARGRLTAHLERSLQLSPDEVDTLLWSPPRALMLAVIPTAHRRLAQQWAGEVPHADDQRVRSRSPLPEYIAGNLFEDLLTPEVTLTLPDARLDESDAHREALPAFRVLREFLPGNVSRHFGIRSFDRRHWVPLPPLIDGRGRIADVSSYAGEFLRTLDGPGGTISIFRPTNVKLERPPDAIFDSTSSGPLWEAHLEALGSGALIEMPSSWRSLLPGLRFHLHADGDGVRVCRYTRRAVGMYRSKTEQEFISVQFNSLADDLEGVGMGAEFEADSVLLQVTVPAPEDVPTPTERTHRLTEVVLGDPELAYLNWTTRTSLASALLLEIVDSGGPDHVLNKTDHALSNSLTAALVRLGLLKVDQSHGEAPLDASEDEARDLGDLVRQEAVLARLRSAAIAAGLDDRDSQWLSWHRLRTGSAAAAVFVDAVSQLVPSFDPADITIDLDPAADPTGDTIDIWVTEQSPGGNGLIEAVHAAVVASSAELRKLLSMAAAPSDLESLDTELKFLLSEANPLVMEAIDSLRSSWEQGHEAASIAVETVRRHWLAATQTDLSRTAISFISTRLGAPGAPSELGPLMARLLARWEEIEARTAFAIDARTFGAICDTDTSLDELLGRNFTDPQRRARFVSGLFWPRGLDVSAGAQVPGGAFGHLPIPALDLLRGSIPPPWPVMPCGSTEIDPEVLATGLAEHGALTLRFQDAGTARTAILKAIEHPLEVGSLFVYPRIVSVTTAAKSVDVVVAAAELDI